MNQAEFDRFADEPEQHASNIRLSGETPAYFARYKAQDAAFAACVFYHIDSKDHIPILRELRRVLTDAGRLFVFEHNPLNLLTRHAVHTCPFDANAVLIRADTLHAQLRTAGFGQASLAYRILFPGALSALRPLERILTRLPLGAQYRLCTQK